MLGDTETRKHPRYALEVVVAIETAMGSLQGRSRNLSRGGLAGEFKGTVMLGQEVMVSLALVFDVASASEPLTIPARVVWCTAIGNAHQVGLAFHRLTARQSQFLDIFLRYVEEGLARDCVTCPMEHDSNDPFAT